MDLSLIPLNIKGSGQRPFVIAGPCSAETEEQVLSTARQLASLGCNVYRAGVWKPRTKPGGFEGVGEPGLAWLNEVQKETGMKVCTEVATHAHVEACLKAGVDLLWIGARTVAHRSKQHQGCSDSQQSDHQNRGPWPVGKGELPINKPLHRNP